MLAFIKGAVAAFSVVAAAAIGIGYILAGQAGLLDSAPGHTVSSVKAAHHRHHGHHHRRHGRHGSGGEALGARAGIGNAARLPNGTSDDYAIAYDKVSGRWSNQVPVDPSCASL